jgi:hypothetical protein
MIRPGRVTIWRAFPAIFAPKTTPVEDFVALFERR